MNSHMDEDGKLDACASRLKLYRYVLGGVVLEVAAADRDELVLILKSVPALKNYALARGAVELLGWDEDSEAAMRRCGERSRIARIVSWPADGSPMPRRSAALLDNACVKYPAERDRES